MSSLTFSNHTLVIDAHKNDKLQKASLGKIITRGLPQKKIKRLSDRKIKCTKVLLVLFTNIHAIRRIVFLGGNREMCIIHIYTK